jgi:putative SOS response-associated peptidase YedK
MCYSAMAVADLRELEREYGATTDFEAIERLFWRRHHERDVTVSKVLELNFENPRTSQEQKIRDVILDYRTSRTRELEHELFKQKKRLGDAERTLKTKTTKKALEDQRIATSKIDQLVKRIADVNRTEPKPGDSRIFPFWYTAIIVDEGKGPTIIPARYHCRPCGKPEFFDRKYDGLYNARRDSLEKFWKELFGKNHAIAQVTSFYENVKLHDYEKRELREGEEETNIVLHFNPQPQTRMSVACLYSRWDSSLVSFAAITDEPPAEIAAVGHDRVVITLKGDNVSAWLNPASADLASLYRLFDDRERPFFEHRKAA